MEQLSSFKKRRLAIIDLDTAEIVRELNEGDGFHKGNDSVNLSENHVFANWHYSKLSTGAFEAMQRKQLSNTQWNLLWYLCNHLRYRSCEVRYNNGKHLRIERITEKLSTSEATVRRSLAKLEQEGFICKVSGDPLTIYINPYFMMRGSVIPQSMEALFFNTEFYKKTKGE